MQIIQKIKISQIKTRQHKTLPEAAHSYLSRDNQTLISTSKTHSLDHSHRWTLIHKSTCVLKKNRIQCGLKLDLSEVGTKCLTAIQRFVKMI